MPTSFEVDDDDNIIADSGDRAIASRLVPVDSAVRWMIPLRIYTMTSIDVTPAPGNGVICSVSSAVHAGYTAPQRQR